MGKLHFQTCYKPQTFCNDGANLGIRGSRLGYNTRRDSATQKPSTGKSFGDLKF